MSLHQLKPARGARHRRKRIGRGPGSGHGKTACAGNKGQRSRTGDSALRGFEGGQMPLHRRLPKRGFTNNFRTLYHVVNLEQLKGLPKGSEVTPESLRAAGLVKSPVERGVKLLGDGEAPAGLKVRVHRISQQARQKVEAAGGSVELIA
jgi:large subunit ribosomal protein L15